MIDFKAILKELYITERQLGILCDSSAVIYGGVDRVLTVSLGDGTTLRSPPNKLLGLPPISFLGVSLAQIPIADRISRLDNLTNEFGRTVQAALGELPKTADAEGLQEDRETAGKCLALCDKINKAAAAEYQKQLPLCIRVLEKAIGDTDDCPMALRNLRNRLASFKSTLLSLKQAEVDNPKGPKIPLHACLRECQGLLAADLRNIAQTHIMASSLMFELYENTMTVALGVTDPYVVVIPLYSFKRLIDYKPKTCLESNDSRNDH